MPSIVPEPYCVKSIPRLGRRLAWQQPSPAGASGYPPRGRTIGGGGGAPIVVSSPLLPGPLAGSQCRPSLRPSTILRQAQDDKGDKRRFGVVALLGVTCVGPTRSAAFHLHRHEVHPTD